MDSCVFDRIRGACRSVAEDARYVRVRGDRVAAYVAGLPLEIIAHPSHDPDRHHLGRGEETVAFFLTLDSINFGSGFFPRLRKRSGMSGYYTIAAALNDRFKASGPLGAGELAAMTPAHCAHLFGQEMEDGAVAELMGLFSRALTDLGRLLLDRYEGSFTALAAAAAGSAARLVDLLCQMPLFRDEADYRGRRVPFYKRAQITAADLHTAFDGTGPGHFTDIDRLTLFADNLVPHVLRLDGILEYDAGLLAAIERQEPIAAGSQQETEIRACAVHAVERMVEALGTAGHGATARGLDYLLWNRGQQPAYKARPRHRARSVYY